MQIDQGIIEMRAAGAIWSGGLEREISMKFARASAVVLATRWHTFEQATFGLFMGSLVMLLILTYAGVPVIAGP